MDSFFSAKLLHISKWKHDIIIFSLSKLGLIFAKKNMKLQYKKSTKSIQFECVIHVLYLAYFRCAIAWQNFYQTQWENNNSIERFSYTFEQTIFLFVCMFFLSVCLSVYLSTCLFLVWFFMHVCLSVHLSVCLLVCLSVCMSVPYCEGC